MYTLLAGIYGEAPYFERDFGSTEEAVLFAVDEFDLSSAETLEFAGTLTIALDDYAVLQIVEEDELPAGVEAVCESCSKPCEYDSEMCLCVECEEE